MVQRRFEDAKGVENLFKEIIKENFQNPEKVTNIQV
jgi:hypothetical protein